MAIKLDEQVRAKAEAFYRFDVSLDRRHFSISRTAIGSRFIGFLFAMPSIFFLRCINIARRFAPIIDESAIFHRETYKGINSCTVWFH